MVGSWSRAGPYRWVLAALLFLVAIAAAAEAKELWGVEPRNLNFRGAQVHITNANPGSTEVATVYDSGGVVATYSVPPSSSVVHRLTDQPTGSQRTFDRTWYVDGSDFIFGTILTGDCACDYTSDASRLLARSGLGDDYWAFNPYRPGDDTWFGFLSIVAVEDNTVVEVTPSKVTNGGLGVPSIPAGSTATFTLDKFELLHIEAGGAWGGGAADLSGSHVTGDKNFAVFAGYGCINNPSTACDTYQEQLHPVVRAGVEFTACSQRVIDPTLKDRYKIIATAPGPTTVTFDPPAIGGISTVTLTGPGDWEAVMHDEDVYISSDQPIQVVQAPESFGGGVVVDPSYIELTPVSFWQGDHNFPVPSGGWLDSLSVAAPSAATVTLDGGPLSGWSTIGSSSYSCITVGVSDGDHLLSSDLGSTLTVLGRSSYSSYYYVSDDLLGDVVADFDWDLPAPCVHGVQHFIDLSTTVASADMARAVWRWGDGTTTVVDPWTLDVYHRYDAPGTYTINLTVTDDRGKTASIEKEYEVCNDPPLLMTPSESFVVEGRQLIHWAETSDPNGDDVVLSTQNAPPGLVPGMGGKRLFWQTQPGDSLGSPYAFDVVATDVWGAETRAEVKVHVLPPSVMPPGAPDSDRDGIADDVDNCPFAWNPQQTDDDADGLGDACVEADGGGGSAVAGVSAGGVSTSKETVPAGETTDVGGGSTWTLPGDMDADGVLDAADNCVRTPNPVQLDQDQDGIGNACDPDIDGDGVLQVDPGGRPMDLCPYDPEPRRVDGCPLEATQGGQPGTAVAEGAEDDAVRTTETDATDPAFSAKVPIIGGAIGLLVVGLLLLVLLRRR